MLLRAPGQQVARELLDREFVERLVLVERRDDVIAVRPDVARRVRVIADRVGKAHDIEPRHGHPLAVMRARDQPVDQALVGVRRLVRDEGLRLREGRRHAGEIERKPADQRAAIRLGRRLQPDGREPPADQRIDRVRARRDLGLSPA